LYVGQGLQQYTKFSVIVTGKTNKAKFLFSQICCG
jgi:hypothetical protein